MHSVLYLTFVLTAKAAVVPLITPRALPPGCDEVYEDIPLVEFNDGPTSSGEAGIGAEFETLGIQFSNNRCSLEDTFLAKRKTIRGHSGKNFVLSVDTSVEQGKGRLSAEYVLDGRSIKVGDGSAAAAAKAVQGDLANWRPWSETPANQVIIENYPQCPDPWTVQNLDENKSKDQIFWAPQITASMPLEALYSLMKENVQNVQDNRNVLNGESVSNKNNIQLVTADIYFDHLWLQIDKDKINDAVLGFCSLVLSYAKAANNRIDKTDPNTLEKSPKSWISFMPRTDFVTIYRTVKSFFPADDELFNIFNTLACYKTKFNKDNNKFEVSLDTDYCGGSLDQPVRKPTFAGLRYEYIGNFAKPGIPTTLSIKEWIESIGKGDPSPDMLTTFDKHYDESIGGLGTQVEKMFQLDRTAPLFEFRDLTPLQTSDFEKFMGEVDSSIQALHKKFAARPPLKKVKRDASACQLPPNGSPTTKAPTTPAPAMPSCSLQNEDPDQGINARGCVCGSTTLPLLTISNAKDESQSCSYTAMPTSKVANPITIESQVYTANCYLCTLIGGIADTPSCATTPVKGCTPTTPAVPTATVFLSNNSVPIGDENDKNNGADLRLDLFKKLKALCPDKADACDSKTPGEFDKIETVVGNEPAEETLKFTIQDSHYDSPKERDQMIAAAVASWQQAVSKSCKEIDYEDYEDPTKSGCGTGIVKRGTVERALMTSEERRMTPRHALPEPLCDNCNSPSPAECHYKAKVCAGPDHITSILGNSRNGPYANHLNIQLSYQIGHGTSAFNEFACELIVDGLTALALAVAPELAGAEVWEDIELQALCTDIAEHIGSRDANVTENSLLIG